jgi:AraC-like DNA-binding protein
MDTLLRGCGLEQASLESSDSGAALGSSLQSGDDFFVLAKRLASDSEWDWLGALAAMLGEIHEGGTPHAFRSEGVAPDVDRRPDSRARATRRSTEQSRRVAERYRALVRVNAALAKALTLVRASLAHVDEVLPTPRSTMRRGLSCWQERRAKSYLLSNLGSRISNADLAAACGLSQNYFVTAFRESTGETPHACLVRYRLAKAKELLLGHMAIADIALACGFGDQSHLTRVFAKHTGIAPGEWRRERRYRRLQEKVPSTVNAADHNWAAVTLQQEGVAA